MYAEIPLIVKRQDVMGAAFVVYLEDFKQMHPLRPVLFSLVVIMFLIRQSIHFYERCLANRSVHVRTTVAPIQQLRVD